MHGLPLGAWSHRRRLGHSAGATECLARAFHGDHVYSPQNIWPDTHEWVLNTDPDAWATAISGAPDLIDDLLRSPQLDAVRLHRST
jgi:hypothetical protein